MISASVRFLRHWEDFPISAPLLSVIRRWTGLLYISVVFLYSSIQHVLKDSSRLFQHRRGDRISSVETSVLLFLRVLPHDWHVTKRFSCSSLVWPCSSLISSVLTTVPLFTPFHFPLSVWHWQTICILCVGMLQYNEQLLKIWNRHRSRDALKDAFNLRDLLTNLETAVETYSKAPN